MNTKLLYFLISLIFPGCLASLSHDESQELIGQLIEASLRGSIDVMIDLLEQGADVDVRDNRGNTALHWATCNGHLACVKALIEAKADVNARNNNGYTSLTWAAEGGHIGCVKALIEAKSDVNACNNDGNTALHWAARKGHLTCVKALIEAKTDVKTCGNNGETALHWAAWKGDLACLKALIEAKAEVNARDKNGKTALYQAAIGGYLDCLRALLEAKADVNAQDNDGKTALHVAYKWGYFDCLKALVKYSYTLSPSKKAVSESRKRIFKFLGAFVGLRKQHLHLAGLQDTTLQYEILSWDRDLQQDLVVILLDELKKGKEIKNVALIRSKEAAVSYLAKKVKEMVPTILDKVENLDDLIKEGLGERINQLKSKVGV